MPTDLFTDDLGTLSNDDLYAAIEELTKAQPNEGWRLDYTEQWDDSALKNIAAFAHSFGGLLIVGVRKTKGDVAPELLGTESSFEYKTRIASAIAANISPVPSYSIFECYKPGNPTTKFCVVRVRESKVLHLVTKKGLDPVYIRNEDEVRPANAEQLRMLIDRERETPALSQNIGRRAIDLQVSKSVRFGYKDQDSDAWHMSPYQDSTTFLKLEMIPAEAVRLELERSHETSLWRFVSDRYPRVLDTLRTGVALRAEIRTGQSYELVWYHKALGYEGRWRIMSTGEIGHATQVKYHLPGVNQGVWSVVDLAQYVILFVRLNMKWWEYIGYFGGGYLFVQLNVPGLSLLRHPDGYFTYAFDVLYQPNRVNSRPSIRKDALLSSPSPGTGADATAKVEYFTNEKNLSRLTTSVLKQVLRPLGYAVVWDLLQESIDSLVGD
jgi:hypothetical protein